MVFKWLLLQCSTLKTYDIQEKQTAKLVKANLITFPKDDFINIQKHFICYT